MAPLLHRAAIMSRATMSLEMCVQSFAFLDSPTPISFLEEYTSVMKPVVQALNILQSETKMFMGYLLPTLSILRQSLHLWRGRQLQLLVDILFRY